MAFALVGGTVIDGNGGDVLNDGTVVVDGERIAAVGTADQVADHAVTESFDVRGKTVVPGLIDSHIHIIAAAWE